VSAIIEKKNRGGDKMYFSRVIMGKVEPDKHEEAFAIFKDDIIPAAKEQQGFRGANLFTNPQTGQFISTTIWKTEEDMITSDQEGYLKEQLEKVAAFLTGPPVIESYIVHY
jgi:heme-degrading monooxygenase HmoA